MDALKVLFESLDFQNVRTYIQSGNLIFTSPETDITLLEKQIKTKLESTLGYPVTIILRTQDELAQVIQNNPFPIQELKENEKLHVTFLAAKPTLEAEQLLLSYQNDIDSIKILNREVYILCRNGYGSTMYSNNFIEKKLKLLATTRNWATVNKLLSLASDLKS